MKKSKAHLKKSKKKKGASRLKERYDDFYDPDSDDDGVDHKKPKMRNAQKFHSLQASDRGPKNKLPFPMPSGKTLN